MTEMIQPDPDPISVREQKLYAQEYKHGVQLFQKALVQYTKSEDLYQKEEFKGVMDKAMHVLIETARELRAQRLLTQNEKIAKDYAALIDKPENEQMIQCLTQDLEQAKRSIDL